MIKNMAYAPVGSIEGLMLALNNGLNPVYRQAKRQYVIRVHYLYKCVITLMFIQIKNMDTSKLLQEKCLYSNKTVKDVIYECLEREGILVHPNDLDCENYLEREFKQYKSIEDFAFEYSKDKLKNQINSLFKDPNNVPKYLIDAIIDDYFTTGWSNHEYAVEMKNYGVIASTNYCFVKNIKDINYYLVDILDTPIYLDNYENLKEKLRNYLSK